MAPPSWAMTIDKCQGQNISKTIMVLSSPPTSGNHLTANHVYVALSHSQGRDEIKLMRLLSDMLRKVLSLHINKALRADNWWLTWQAQDTKRMFKNNMLFDSVWYATQYDEVVEPA